MNITQQLCCPGAAENQDYIRLGENIAMVVDGSTPLVKDPRVPEVREYVRLLADAVVGAEGEDLPHMVAAGIETLRRRCGVLPETEGVSAALAILREKGEQVEVFVLGDCAAGVRFRDGRGPELVSQEAVSRLDGAVVAEMCRLHRERGIDVIEARQLPEVREMLLRHRRMMNRPEATGSQASPRRRPGTAVIGCTGGKNSTEWCCSPTAFPASGRLCWERRSRACRSCISSCGSGRRRTAAATAIPG